MKRSIKAVMGAAGALTALELGICGFCYYEALNKNAKLPAKIMEAENRKNEKRNAGKPEVPETPQQIFLRSTVEWLDAQPKEEYELINSRGQRLRGWYIPAKEESQSFAFLSHGYRSSARGSFCHIVKFYHDNNINVFMVDHQAMGKSEGNWISFGKYESEDCIGWLNFMNDRFGDHIKILLHGISMGSATVMLMSGRDDLPKNVVFTVADCGFTTMKEEFLHNLTAYKVPLFPLVPVTDFFNLLINKTTYSRVAPIESVKKAKVPILFFHGDKDSLVPTRMGYEVYNACSSEKELVIVKGAAHANSYETNHELYESKILDFITRFF